MDRQHMYADGLERVTLLEGLVRLDFYCANESLPDGKVSHEPAGRLMLPPAAFLRAYEAMGQLVARMEEAGLVQRRQGSPAAPESPPPSSPLPSQPGKVQASSPNFA